MSRLALEGVSKRFGSVVALDGIDLAVAEGELCVLLGPSGCGKSTLLRCVAGLETLDAGAIRLGGTRIDGWSPGRRDVAMVFQSYALYPHLTVRGNLEFPLRVRRAPRAERTRRVEEAARLLGLAALLDRRPRALSGGQRQRVAIGRALVRDPALFLLDEPLSNLDARLRHEMRLELVRLHRRLGVTVLHVTHDQTEALTLAEKLVVMRAGRIEQIGAPGEIYARPATLFVARFVGSPPMNVFEGRVAGGRFRAPGLDVAVPEAPEGEAVLGVRPEDVTGGPGAGRARVEWIEDLGADRFAHLRLGGNDLTMRAAGEPPAPGAEIDVRFEPARLHLFVGGRRVDHAAGAAT